ncbi:MAG: hypothetical protein ACE5D7_05180, partial [Fidelibacterota bacterium]
MKITTTFLLMGIIFSSTNTFSVFTEEDGATHIKFIKGPIEFRQVGDYTRISIPSKGRTMDFGMPELPLYTTFFQLEPGIDYSVTYDVVRSHSVSDIDLFPNQDSHTDWSDGDMIELNSDYYET